MLKFYTILISFLVIYNSGLIAQPYVYQKTQDTSYNKDNFPFVWAIKIDLTNGRKEKVPFYTDYAYDIDNTQTWLIGSPISWRDLPLEASFSNINDDKIRFPIFDIQPNEAVYSKVNNKLFLIGDNREGNIFQIINTLTGEEELSKSNFHYGQGNMFLSNDESRLYISENGNMYPNSKTKMNIAIYSTSSNKLLKTQNLKNLGFPKAWFYALKNGNRGKGIMESIMKKNGKYIGSYYSIYDFDKNLSSPFIFSKEMVNPYFTNNGKYLIFSQQIDSVRDDVHYFTDSGVLKIYNVSNQRCVKTLSLPPKREVETFDNFPDYIYYYNDKTEKAITLNIDSIVNNPSGPTNSPKVIMYNLGTTYFTADFINGKINYELGTGFTIIKPEPSAGDKLIYNEYDENNNLLGVFSFDKGYIKGTYTKDKNKKVLHFSRIDQEP